MLSNFTFLKKNSVKSSPLFQPKIRQLKRHLFAVLFFVLLGFSAKAQIWLNPLTTGRPIATNYLGDKLASEYFFNFEIGQSGWNASEVGIGQNTDGATDWSWATATWYQNSGDTNKYVHRDIGNFQFTATGTWYAVGRAKTNSGDAWNYADEGGWSNETTLTASTTLKYCPYFTVNALEGPTSLTATPSSISQINLSLIQWNSKNVMIVRRLTSEAASTAPTQGTTYAVGVSVPQLGTGTVVYNSNGTSFNDTGLTPGTSYTYTFYSENNSYYSPGATETASTSTQTSAATDYFRSQTSGNWGTAGTWESSPDNTNWITSTLVPDGSATSITIQSGHTVTLVADATAKALIITGTLDCSSYILNIAAAGTFTNNGAFTQGTGTVNFVGAGTVNGSTATTFKNLTINTGEIALSTVPTIDGVFTINSGALNAAPKYTSNSTLYYNVGYNRYYEWNATGIGTLGTTPGYPNNVTVNTGTLTVLNGDVGTARAMAGNLVVNTDATFTTGALNAIVTVGGNLITNGTGTVKMSSTSANLNVVGDVSNAGTIDLETATGKLKATNLTNTGTITLSSVVGGDLELTGSLVENATFNANQRAIFFTGTGVQEVSGISPFDINYIVSNKASGSVKMLCDLLCEGPNTGHALVLTNTTDILDLNGFALTIGKMGIASDITGSGFIKGGTTSSISILGTGELGTINFDQTTPGTTNVLNNLTISRVGNVSLASDLKVATLTVNSSAVMSVGTGVTLTLTGTTTNAGTITNLGTITNSGSLKNTSSASGTGYLLSTSSITNVTQERYLTSNQRGWRLLSNPLSTITFGTLASGSTTPFTLGANTSGVYNSVGDTWTNYTDPVNMDNMFSQQAYKVFIRGRSSEVTGLTYYVHPPSNVTVSIKGTAANTAPAEITTVAGQYYLVANPYTAPVSLASVLGASSNLSTTVSYYNPTKASAGGTDLEIKKGGYDTITVSGVAGSTTDVVLPPMGAIFVLASSAGTINIPTSVIYTGAISGGNYSHKTASPQNVTPIALTVKVSSNGVDYDKLQLRFKEAGTVGSNIDFGKMPNTILDFYSIDGANNMAVSELELVAQTIPLGINSTALQSFRFSIAENSIPAGFEAVLEDKLLNTQTVLTTGTNYDFSIDATAASQGKERFDIILKTTAPLSVKDNTLDTKIVIWPNPAHNQFYVKNNQQEGDATIKIYSMTGQLIHSDKAVPGATTTLNANGWASGQYILEATHNGAKTTKQLIIQ